MHSASFEHNVIILGRTVVEFDAHSTSCPTAMSSNRPCFNKNARLVLALK